MVHVTLHCGDVPKLRCSCIECENIKIPLITSLDRKGRQEESSSLNKNENSEMSPLGLMPIVGLINQVGDPFIKIA